MAYIPDNKIKKNHRHNKRIKDNFYSSNDWVKLIKPMKEVATHCAYTKEPFKPGDQKVAEHFRPRRLFPHLELDPNNIFIVSHKANNAKSAREQYIKTPEAWEKLVLPFYKHVRK